MTTPPTRHPVWTIIPALFTLFLLALHLLPIEWGVIYNLLLALGLITSVASAVYHAEIIAYVTGEPLGTLVLALAVTIIEVALIVSIMLSLGDAATVLARDTVFATVMIILNLIIGLCFLIGGIRFGEQSFRLSGVSTALTTLAAIVVLTLILPNYTVTVAGPIYTKSQLGFVALVSIVLYGLFIFVQAVRHRDYFLMKAAETKTLKQVNTLPKTTILASVGLLLGSLIAVVLAAKLLSPEVERLVSSMGAPKALVGIIIAFIVLMPEGFASLRAAFNNRLQTSLNLALGSALATIGLTIPVVALVALTANLTLTLGLDSKSIVLLVLSLFITALSTITGRVTIMQGAVHCVLFLTYLFMTIVP